MTTAAQRVSAVGRTLRPGELWAWCAKGHDRLDFTDHDAFAAHMAEAHRVKGLQPGGPLEPGQRNAPGWAAGRIEKPYPHEAPKPTRGGLDKVVKDLEAGKYDMPLTYTGPVVRFGESVA